MSGRKGLKLRIAFKNGRALDISVTVSEALRFKENLHRKKPDFIDIYSPDKSLEIRKSEVSHVEVTDDETTGI